MIRLVAFVLGCVAGYTLKENIELITGDDDPTLKRVEDTKELKTEEK